MVIIPAEKNHTEIPNNAKKTTWSAWLVTASESSLLKFGLVTDMDL